MLKHRVQKVQRYSFQRPFIEVYRLAPDYDRWLRDPAASFAGAEVAVQPKVNLLPRRAPYPDFAQRRPQSIAGAGTVERRAAVFIGPEFGTVSRPDLVQAAREAADAGFDVLIACAFSFEAHTTEFTKLGSVPVLKALSLIHI